MARRVLTHDLATSTDETAWMSLYFSAAVWRAWRCAPLRWRPCAPTAAMAATGHSAGQSRDSDSGPQGPASRPCLPRMRPRLGAHLDWAPCFDRRLWRRVLTGGPPRGNDLSTCSFRYHAPVRHVDFGYSVSSSHGTCDFQQINSRVWFFCTRESAPLVCKFFRADTEKAGVPKCESFSSSFWRR
jgi:hypothetical protein